jgi:hypothetical protein
MNTSQGASGAYTGQLNTVYLLAACLVANESAKDEFRNSIIGKTDYWTKNSHYRALSELLNSFWTVSKSARYRVTEQFRNASIYSSPYGAPNPTPKGFGCAAPNPIGRKNKKKIQFWREDSLRSPHPWSLRFPQSSANADCGTMGQAPEWSIPGGIQ